MIKKLAVTWCVALLMGITLQWPSIKTAFASTFEMSRQSSSLSLAIKGMTSQSSDMASQATDFQNEMIRQASYRPMANRPGFLTASKTPVNDLVAMSLSAPNQVDLTKSISLTGNLKDLYTGESIVNKTITFSIGGVYQGQTHTDEKGMFTIDLSNNLPAGKYMIAAYFKGAHLLEPASASAWVEVLPATIRVQTIPAIAGIKFQIYGQQFVSGPDGFATVQINAAGQYRLDVLIDEYQDPSQQVKFGRWTDETFQPYRVVDVPDDNVIQVGLNIYHKVSLKFVDLDGYPVDPARISSISIRSVQGDVFSLKPTDTPWLPASRTARRQSGLDVTDLLYSINSVVIDGSNVVNSAQQRFYAKVGDTWTITLLLYSLNISTKDGLFASPIGKSIDLIFPNGQTRNYALDQTGTLDIHALARGIYHISVKGVQGLGTTTPVALSRNQVVKLNIVTRADIAVAACVGFGFAFGLIVYGRPRLVTSLFRRKRTQTTSWDWIQKNES
jgi:hypothetical protein